VKVASGVYMSTQAFLYIEGSKVPFHLAGDARHAGIESVQQDLGLVDSMSIAGTFSPRRAAQGTDTRPP
jgi:ABC-type sugar transport system ATPase subunit